MGSGRYKWLLIALALISSLSLVGPNVLAFNNTMPDIVNDITDSDSTQSGNASLVSGQTQFVRETTGSLRIWFTTNSGQLTIYNYNFCDSDRSDFVQGGDYFANNDISNGTIITIYSINGINYYGKKYANTDTTNCHASKTISFSNLPQDEQNSKYYYADIVVTHNDLHAGNCNNSGLSGCDGIMNYYKFAGPAGSLIGISAAGRLTGHAVTMDQTDNTPEYLNYIARFGTSCVDNNRIAAINFYDMDNGGGSGGAQIGRNITMALADETTNRWVKVWPPPITNSTDLTKQTTLYQFPTLNNGTQTVYFNAYKNHKYRLEIRDVYYNNTIQYSLPYSQINYPACPPPPPIDWAVVPSLTVDNPQVFINDTTDNKATWTAKATVTNGPTPNEVLNINYRASGATSATTFAKKIPAWSDENDVITNTIPETNPPKIFTTEQNLCYRAEMPKASGTMNDAGTILTSSAAYTSYACVDAGHKWYITPMVKADKTTISVGDSITWTHEAIISKGPTPSYTTNPSIRIPVNSLETIGSALPVTKQQFVIPSESTSTVSGSETVTYNTPGPVCRTAEVPRYQNGGINSSGVVLSGVNTSATSDPVCITVGEKPSVQVLGGDLNVGKSTTGSVTANVRTSQTKKSTNPKTFGSWAEYGILATGTVTGMASGSGLSGGATSPTNCSIAYLTFANTQTNTNCSSGTTLGNYTFNSKAKVMTNYFTADNTITTSSFSLAGKSGVYKIDTNTIPITTGLTINTSPNIKDTVVIDAPEYNVTIAGDINYFNYVITNTKIDITKIPQVIIIAKNINIKSNVTNIDAWLVAQSGAINTCSDAPTNLIIGSTCSQGLNINGPIMTKDIVLKRTKNSAGNGDVPAETLNLRSDAYLWAYARAKQTTSYKNAYVVELPPRL